MTRLVLCAALVLLSVPGLVFCAALLSVSAVAQQQPSQPDQTLLTGSQFQGDGQLSIGTATSSNLYVSGPKALALIVKENAEVQIDWDEVEANAKGQPNDLGTAISRALLAVRDGTWKPMEDSK